MIKSAMVRNVVERAATGAAAGLSASSEPLANEPERRGDVGDIERPSAPAATGVARKPLPLIPGSDEPLLYPHLITFMHARRYSQRTIEQYAYWIGRLIQHNGGRHPIELSEGDIVGFMTHLTVRERVAPSTQNQAGAALVLLYRDVLGEPYQRVACITRAKIPPRIHVVLSRGEVMTLLDRLHGTPRLVCQILYGSGLRVGEAVSLRVKDVDLDRREVSIYDGKGQKHRTTILPRSLVPELAEHLRHMKGVYLERSARGLAAVPLPHALARKYPVAGEEWPWHWVFPAQSTFVDPVDGKKKRSHLHESVIQKAVALARRELHLTKPVRPHDFRHAFATHSLRQGTDARTLQLLLGHSDLKTTLGYLHACDRTKDEVRSPLDALPGAYSASHPSVRGDGDGDGISEGYVEMNGDGHGERTGGTTGPHARKPSTTNNDRRGGVADGEVRWTRNSDPSRSAGRPAERSRG